MNKEVKQNNDISRKEALSKIGSYGKYAGLTALGTFLILQPKKAQATSGGDDLGSGATEIGF
jgi:hypothetical protein|tara:strand:- start:10 stop:195 length:186 start_codon:yes stop_codon:yes gene_type:complete